MVTITDAELVRALSVVLFTLLSGIASVGWYCLRSVQRRFDAVDDQLGATHASVIDKIDDFKTEFHTEIRGLDRRVTRVEAHMSLRTPSPSEDHSIYAGPERRMGD